MFFFYIYFFVVAFLSSSISTYHTKLCGTKYLNGVENCAIMSTNPKHMLCQLLLGHRMLMAGITLQTVHSCCNLCVKVQLTCQCFNTVLQFCFLFFTPPVGILPTVIQQSSKKCQQLTDSTFSTVSSNSTGLSPGLAGGSMLVLLSCQFPEILLIIAI